MLSITHYRGAKNPRPEGAPTFKTFGGLVRWLEGRLQETHGPATASAEKQKTWMAAWSPVTLTKPHRAAENVMAVTLGVLDVDRGDAEAVIERIEELELDAYLYASPRDNPDGAADARRFRVVMPLSRPLEPEECKDFRRHLAEILGLAPGCGVEGAIEAVKLFFVGRLHDTPERVSWRSPHRDVLDVEAVLAEPLQHDWRARKDRPRGAPSAHRATPGINTAAIAAALGYWEDHDGHKHEICGALGGVMRGTDLLSRGDCEAVIRAWLPSDHPDVDVKHGVDWALNAWEKEPWEVSGREALEAALGEDHAAAVLDAIHAALVPKRARAAREAEAKREAQREEGVTTTEGDNVPLFLQGYTDKIGTFAWDPRVDAYREISLSSLHAFLENTGLGEYVVSEHKGTKLPASTIINDSRKGLVARTVVDFRRGGNEYDPADETMYVGLAEAKLKGKRDARVEAWLAALCGDQLPAVREWIASTAQRHLGRIATALAIVGENDVGKTIFALALARLWGASPVKLGDVVEKFNANMARCPIVLDDECETLGRKRVTTEGFRVLVQNRTREYEPKGLEKRTLLGAQRFILTCNDLSDIRFGSAIGSGAVDAIASRMTVVVCKGENTERVKATRRALPRDESGTVELERIAAHFRWLQETVEMPSGDTRFLGSGTAEHRAAAREMVVAATLEDNEILFERVREVLEGGGDSEAIMRREKGADRGVWVSPAKLALELATLAPTERYDAGMVRNALRPFLGGNKVLRVGGATARMYAVDVARARVALGIKAASPEASRTARDQRTGD